MKHHRFPGSRYALATAVLAVATVCGATIDEVLVTTTSSTTSSTWVAGGIAECDFDLVLPVGGSFESLTLFVGGPLSNSRCRLASNLALAGVKMNGSAYYGYDLWDFSGDLPDGSVLLHCDSDTFIEFGEFVYVEYLDIDASVDTATGSGGEPVAAPRVCARGMSCSYYGGGDLDWDGDPLCGDANYDHRVRAVDALAALRTSVGQPSCVPVSTVCDPNSDGQISTSDALLILRASIHIDVALSCPLPCHPDL